MSNNILRALAKMKLVELDEKETAELKQKSGKPELTMEEIDRIIAESEGAPPSKAKAPTASAPAARPKSPPPSPATVRPVSTHTSSRPIDTLREQVPFADYYAERAVPPSNYPVEKLIKLLEGLTAFDPSTRKRMVLAIDETDDSWHINDVVLDAERKVRALAECQAQLDAALTVKLKTAEEEKAKRENYLTEATATVRRKIAELEQTLATETAQIAEQKGRLDAEVAQSRELCTRERSRISEEIRRLDEIRKTFTG